MKASKTTIVLGIILAAALGWAIVHFFFFKNADLPGVTSSGTPQSAAEGAFIDLAAKLDGITFDTAIFSDSRFTSLNDIRTPILPETAGRRDPFAPVPGTTSTK